MAPVHREPGRADDSHPVPRHDRGLPRPETHSRRPRARHRGEEATAEDLYAIREQLGLHDSWPEQYVKWLGDLLSGDLGYSFTSGLSVNRLFSINVPPTLELGIAAYAFAILLGIPLGILGGVKPRSGWDWLLSGYTMVAVGVPSFVSGIILLWIFAAELGWFPSHGRVSILDDPVTRCTTWPCLSSPWRCPSAQCSRGYAHDDHRRGRPGLRPHGEGEGARGEHRHRAPRAAQTRSFP